MSRLNARPISEWPADLRDSYKLNMAIGDFWTALQEHPLVRRIRPMRDYCAFRATAPYARAVLADMEARKLLALRDQERRRARG